MHLGYLAGSGQVFLRVSKFFSYHSSLKPDEIFFNTAFFCVLKISYFMFINVVRRNLTMFTPQYF